MLILKKELVEQIIRHCRREFPDEACGILSGKDARVEKAYEMTNADKSPQSYLMDAKEQLKVMKEMRAEGLEMVAIYHSHVASPAYPSAHDVKLAFYPEASYLIVSLIPRRKSPGLSPGMNGDLAKEGGSLKAFQAEGAPQDADGPGIRSFKIVEGAIAEEEVRIE